MLKMNRIIPLVFIYFLVFGFSFIALQVTTEEVEAAGVCEPVERIRNMKDTAGHSGYELWKERYQIPRWSRVEDGGTGRVEESECNKNTSEWPLGQV